MAHTPRKRFGQNFLIDDQVINQIISTIAPKTDDNIIEIGPGKGALTFPITAVSYTHLTLPTKRIV